MAQFPVTDQQSIVDGLNYVMSGPGGLGQAFAGVNTYAEGYLTGNFRSPFSSTTTTPLYVAPIALSLAEQLNARTIKYTFASAQPLPPFALGNGLTVTGITPAAYNSANLSITAIGVVECTTTYVIVRNRDVIVGSLGTYVSGGSITYTSMDFQASTDLDVRVGVTSNLDAVFISAQLDQEITYTVSTAPADMTVYVDITRFTAVSNNDATNPEFLFDDATTIVSKQYAYTGLTGTGTVPLLETIFVAITDQPGVGLFRYILEVYFETVSGVLEVTEDKLLLRSISTQVIKP